MGTSIQSWSSREALAKCAPKDTVPKPPAGDKEGNHFSAMIWPLLRLPIKGAIWYQGEANSRNAQSSNIYNCQMRALIQDWREKWYRSSNFSFGIAQLAPSGDASLGVLRWSQRGATTLPGVTMSVGTDLYDETSPCGSVHIRNKTAVGSRLARGSLVAAYGRTNLTWSGPVPAARDPVSVVSGNDAGTLNVKFEGGPGPFTFLAVHNMTSPNADHGNFEVTAQVRPTNITTRWGGWQAVKSAKVLGDGRSVQLDTVHAGTIRGLRHAWGNVPGGGKPSRKNPAASLDGRFLYDASGLPAGMFVLDCSLSSSQDFGCTPVPYGALPAS